MSTMEQEIENVLRAAPRPTPPAGLKERLIAQVRLPAVRPAPQRPDEPAWRPPAGSVAGGRCWRRRRFLSPARLASPCSRWKFAI